MNNSVPVVPYDSATRILQSASRKAQRALAKEWNVTRKSIKKRRKKLLREIPRTTKGQEARKELLMNTI